MATRVGDAADDVEIVADDQDAERKAALQVGEQIEKLALHRDVEPGRRLVGDEEGRLRHQRPRDRDAPRLAAADLVRIFFELRLGEAEPLHEVEHLRPALASVQAVDDDRLGKQPADREARRQRGQRVLEDHLHAPPQPQPVGARQCRQVAALDPHPAGGRAVEPDQRLGERGLAAAALADKAERLADRERRG